MHPEKTPSDNNNSQTNPQESGTTFRHLGLERPKRQRTYRPQTIIRLEGEPINHQPIDSNELYNLHQENIINDDASSSEESEKLTNTVFKPTAGIALPQLPKGEIKLRSWKNEPSKIETKAQSDDSVIKPKLKPVEKTVEIVNKSDHEKNIDDCEYSGPVSSNPFIKAERARQDKSRQASTTVKPQIPKFDKESIINRSENCQQSPQKKEFVTMANVVEPKNIKSEEIASSMAISEAPQKTHSKCSTSKSSSEKHDSKKNKSNDEEKKAEKKSQKTEIPSVVSPVACYLNLKSSKETKIEEEQKFVKKHVELDNQITNFNKKSLKKASGNLDCERETSPPKDLTPPPSNENETKLKMKHKQHSITKIENTDHQNQSVKKCPQEVETTHATQSSKFGDRKSSKKDKSINSNLVVKSAIQEQGDVPDLPSASSSSTSQTFTSSSTNELTADNSDEYSSSTSSSTSSESSSESSPAIETTRNKATARQPSKTENRDGKISSSRKSKTTSNNSSEATDKSAAQRSNRHERNWLKKSPKSSSKPSPSEENVSRSTKTSSNEAQLSQQSLPELSDSQSKPIKKPRQKYVKLFKKKPSHSMDLTDPTDNNKKH